MKHTIIFICIFVWTGSYGQSFLQSKEFSVRNDFFYDIITLKSEKVLLFRNKANSYTFEVLNRSLTYEKSIDIEFEEEIVSIENILSFDSLIQIFYSYKNDFGDYLLKMVEYNENVVKIDTSITLFESSDKMNSGSFRSETSQDLSKTILFGPFRDKLKLFIFDNKKNEILYSAILDQSNFDYKDDFRKIIITNSGKIFLVFEKNNSLYKREQHSLGIFETSIDDDFIFHEVSLSNTVNSGLQAVFNEEVQELLIGGLYSEKKIEELLGYFIIKYINGTKSSSLTFSTFDSDVFLDIYGNRGKRNNNFISDFYLNEIVPQKGGGFVLISEMRKEFLRRPSYSNMSAYDGNYTMNGFVDFYNEDILINCISERGENEWNKVLYKKQFSQDDNSIYSSYFKFTTASRLHLFYNDEIKKNSTVSEYVLSPNGSYERNAIINTEYKDLQLRFKNSKQISSTEFLVPSEKNYKLSIVKIKL